MNSPATRSSAGFVMREIQTGLHKPEGGTKEHLTKSVDNSAPVCFPHCASICLSSRVSFDLPLAQMIDALPARALVTADAGFVGYEYCKALIDSGRHLLIRVGANVKLLKNVGFVKEKNGLVYLWPDREACAKPTAAGFATGRGTRRQASGLSGHVGRGQSDPFGQAGGGDLWPSLGHRALLSPLQANVRAPQIAEPFRRQRRVGGDLVAVGTVGNESARSSGTGARVSRRDGSAWPNCCGRIGNDSANTRAIPTLGNRSANSCPRP